MRFKKQDGSSLLMAVIIAAVVAIIIIGMSYKFLIQKNYIKVSIDMASQEIFEDYLSDMRKTIINNNLNIKNTDVSLNLNQINNGLIISHTNDLDYDFKYTFKKPNVLYNSNSLYTADAYIDYNELEEIMHSDSSERALVKNNISGHYTIPVTQTYRNYTNTNIVPINVPLIDMNNMSKLRQSHELNNKQISDLAVGFVGAFLIDENGFSYVSKNGSYRSPNIKLDNQSDKTKMTIGWELSNGQWQLYIAIYSANGVSTSHTSLNSLIKTPNLAVIDLQLNLQVVKKAKNDSIEYTAYWYNAEKNNASNLYLAIIETITSSTKISLNFSSYTYQNRLNIWLPDSDMKIPIYKLKPDNQAHIQILNIDEKHNLLVSKSLIFVLDGDNIVLSTYVISNSDNNTSINYSPIFDGWFIPKNHDIVNSPTAKGTFLYTYKKNSIGRFVIESSGYIYLENQIDVAIPSLEYDIYSNYNSIIVSAMKSIKNQKYNQYYFNYINIQSDNSFVEYSTATEKRRPNNKTEFDLIYDIDIGKLYLKSDALKCRLHILNGKECSSLDDIYINNNLVPSIHTQRKSKVDYLNKINDSNDRLQLEYLYIKEQPKNIVADQTYAICSIRSGKVAFFSTKKISKNLNIQNADLKGYLTTNSIKISASHLINNKSYDGHLLSIVPIDYKSKSMPEYSVVCEIQADDGENYLYKTL